MSDESDAKILNDVQERFDVNITELPDEIDLASYSKFDFSTIRFASYIIRLVMISTLIDNFFLFQLKDDELNLHHFILR